MVTMTAIVSLAVMLVLGQYGSIECFQVSKTDSPSHLRWRERNGSSRIVSPLPPFFLYPKKQQSHQTQQKPKPSKHQHTHHQAHPHHHQQFPIPAMPSDNFRKMAQSQLELLANSLTRNQPTTSNNNSNSNSNSNNGVMTKVQSMILYLPQENSYSGQLEFTPGIVWPDPSTERVFIASDAASGQAPTLPKSLSKLPGFSSAPELLPGYPMLSSSEAAPPGVGLVEEVLCDIRFKTSALSVPLLSGSQTVGVLLVSPTAPSGSSSPAGEDKNHHENDDNSWTQRDKEQVSLAAQSLSMALNMDNERRVLSAQNTLFRENLSDSLHQMKNPIQALRTYGKILQRQIVENEQRNGMGATAGTAQLLELAERLMVQSDRVVDMLGPMDSLVETLEDSPVLLPPADATKSNHDQPQSMVLYDRLPPSSSSSSNSNSAAAATTSNGLTRQRRNQPINTTIAEEDDDFRSTTTALPTTTSTSSSSLSKPSSTTTSSPIVNKKQPPSTAAAAESTATNGLLASTTIGDFETEIVFVTDVLEPVLDTFSAIASEQGIAFEVLVDDIDDLPGVFVAPKSFREATSNVLDNALKYAILPKEGSPLDRNPSPKVRVSIFPHDEHANSNIRGSGVTVLVEDNGPGVATDDQHLIFDRGFRSDKTSGEVEGRGIGLDISRALLARMGGYLGLATPDDFDENCPACDDRLDGAALKLQVTRKPLNKRSS